MYLTIGKMAAKFALKLAFNIATVSTVFVASTQIANSVNNKIDRKRNK